MESPSHRKQIEKVINNVRGQFILHTILTFLMSSDINRLIIFNSNSIQPMSGYTSTHFI